MGELRGEWRGDPFLKPLGAEYRTNKLNPHMKPSLGIEPGPHWWEGSVLHPQFHFLELLYVTFCLVNKFSNNPRMKTKKIVPVCIFGYIENVILKCLNVNLL